MKDSFSPITSEAKLKAAIEYLANAAAKLPGLVLGRDLSLDTLCFFAQTPEEYAFLEQAVRRRGPVSRFTHGATLYVDCDFTVGDNNSHITIFGVRQPDPTRQWLGYGDYPVDDYPELLKMIEGNSNAKEITSGRGQSLIELRHPDINALGYVFNRQDHV